MCINEAYSLSTVDIIVGRVIVINMCSEYYLMSEVNIVLMVGSTRD